MKAIVQDEYGPPEVLKVGEVDKPEAGQGEVLVRVRRRVSIRESGI